MKATLLTITAAIALGLLASDAGPVPQGSASAQPPEKAQPDPRAKDAEPLPDAPKLDPKNNLVELSPDKTFFIEQNPDKKFLRVLRSEGVV